MAPELLEEAEEMVVALEALAKRLEAKDPKGVEGGGEGAEGGTPEDETPFDRLGKFLRGD